MKFATDYFENLKEAKRNKKNKKLELMPTLRKIRGTENIEELEAGGSDDEYGSQNSESNDTMMQVSFSHNPDAASGRKDGSGENA